MVFRLVGAWSLELRSRPALISQERCKPSRGLKGRPVLAAEEARDSRKPKRKEQGRERESSSQDKECRCGVLAEGKGRGGEGV